MSHFFTVVLVPKDTQDIEAKVEELMASYDENIEVAEYDKDCWCIGSKARHAAVEAVEIAKGPLSAIRDTFWNEVNNELSLMGISPNASEYWEKREEVASKLNWDERIKEYSDYEKMMFENHPMFGKPVSDCEECNGTGTYKSTYNPDSKWDWWVIGGRWDGSIQNNQRKTENGFNFGAQHHQLIHNTIPTDDYLEICRNDNGQYPFSIVAPDGTWHQKGRMGWFGISSDENENWKQSADALLEKYKDCIAVGVDCHI